MNWLNSPFINNAEVARQLGISLDLFNKKKKDIFVNKFSDEQLSKLEIVKENIIKELQKK